MVGGGPRSPPPWDKLVGKGGRDGSKEASLEESRDGHGGKAAASSGSSNPSGNGTVLGSVSATVPSENDGSSKSKEMERKAIVVVLKTRWNSTQQQDGEACGQARAQSNLRGTCDIKTATAGSELRALLSKDGIQFAAGLNVNCLKYA